MKSAVLFVVALFAAAGCILRAQDVAGTWQGTLHDDKQELRLVIKITNGDGKLSGTMYSIDQGGDPIALSSVNRPGDTVNFAIALIGGSFSGRFSADGNSIVGAWTQGKKPEPLTLVRASEETVWEIPKPPAPMARDANPSFEVATIKPSKPGPDGWGKGFGEDGRNITTQNTSLNDLIEYAYDVHSKQIVGAPDWADSAKFDLAGVPDLPGAPDDEQSKKMLQKLLADRFQLRFHLEKRVLSVYVLSVAKGGPKNLTKSADPEEGFSIPIGGARGGLEMTVQNGTMTNFAVFGLQGAVLDRPVLDRTGLADRYDFGVKWMPDDSQFGGKMQLPAMKDPQPDLFTAIREQLGLKLEPTKTAVDVMMIDHAETPSPN
jgi:uncharacterized protein (TIGR03435 family)